MTYFSFTPRWKEELACTSAEGQFALDYDMGGAPVTYLPTAEAWPARAPDWARDLWPELESQLRSWCAGHGVKLVLRETANVYPGR